MVPEKRVGDWGRMASEARRTGRLTRLMGTPSIKMLPVPMQSQARGGRESEQKRLTQSRTAAYSRGASFVYMTGERAFGLEGGTLPGDEAEEGRDERRLA